MSTISVIIPCYNRATLIGETIQNMLDQSYPPDEIIVVNDGSTDGSEDVIHSFGGIVKLISQRNGGAGAARNCGLKMATGEFIQFMDSDDLASINKLEVQINALKSSKADFAYCPWVRSVIENGTIRFTDKILQTGPVPSIKPMLEYFLSGWTLVFQNCLFRKNILDSAGLFRTDLLSAEDSEYFVRIMLTGALPIFTPECLLFYREHNYNKLTVSGLSAEQRASDWTNYLEITGNSLENYLSKISFYTKISLASNVYNHLKYCKDNNIRGLPIGHPYLNIISPPLLPIFHCMRIYEKVKRKLTGTGDLPSAYLSQPASNTHKKLVHEMRYRVYE